MSMFDSYENDIPLNLAQAAHNGTSHVPEQRAKQEQTGYAATLRHDLAAMLNHADTDEKKALLVEEFERYRAGYKARALAYLLARSRCVSTMIAGGSNFPVRRQQKIGAVADRRGAELAEYRIKALAAIRRALTPELAPILTSDDNAVARLDDKASKLEALQALMKATNAAIRKYRRAGTADAVAALVALGHSEAVARELLKPDELGRTGYADYQIKNNNANIRRAKSRAVAVAEVQATPGFSQMGATGTRLEDAPADNRVRLFFPDKPDAATRAKLKSHGFRWAPSIGCWQAYRNMSALGFAARIAGVS